MSGQQPTPFCPTCLATVSLFDRSLERTGLDPAAHWGWRSGRGAIRRHGIVRILQDVSVGMRKWRRGDLAVDTTGRQSIRVRVRIMRTDPSYRHARHGSGGTRIGVGRTWAECPDPWHDEMRRRYTLPRQDKPVVTRPKTERPPKDEISDRKKARARTHKARQAKR